MPATVATAPAELKPADVTSVKDWFAWYKLREDYRKSGKTGDEMEAAFQNAAKRLETENPPKAFNDAIELMAFNWKIKSGAPIENGKNVFVASWLFRKKGDVNLAPDHDVRLVLRTAADPSHLQYLPRNLTNGFGYVELTYSVDGSFAEWKKGEYYLVSRETVVLPILPYKMGTFFSEVLNAGGYVGPFGQQLGLGWYADLGDPAAKATQ
jgi:hypothetical protein